MNLEQLLAAVKEALEIRPPAAILGYCQGYFSPYYMLMYILACEQNGLCVELGVEGGRGSNAMLQAGVEVIGVDNNHKPEIDRIINDPKYTFIHASSLPVPEMIAAKGKEIAVLHIDTEHSFAQAREEFNAYRPYLKDGAVVLFDDANAMEGAVWDFVESLPYEKFKDDRLHPSCGYGGIIYRDPA